MKPVIYLTSNQTCPCTKSEVGQHSAVCRAAATGASRSMKGAKWLQIGACQDGVDLGSSLGPTPLENVRMRPSRSPFRFAVLTLALCSATEAVTLFAEPSSAHARPRSGRAPEKTEAEKLADKATEAVKDKDYERAVDLFSQAEKLEPGPRWLIGRARVHADAGAILFARKMLREARDGAATDAHKAQLDLAIAEIQARIPIVRVEVLGPALSRRRLQVDGETVPIVSQSSVELDPGSHRFQATAPGFRPISHEANVSEGEVHTVTLAMTPEFSPEPRAERPPPESHWQQTLGYTSFAVAGAAAITGTVFFLQRQSHSNDADARFASCNPHGCSADERAVIDSLDQDAARDGTLAAVGLGTAVLATGAGFWLMADELGLSSREEPDAVAVYPSVGGASIIGRF